MNPRETTTRGEWDNGRKVYARHDDGTPALWWDEEAGTLNDAAEAIPVDDEDEADSEAARWLAAMDIREA